MCTGCNPSWLDFFNLMRLQRELTGNSYFSSAQSATQRMSYEDLQTMLQQSAQFADLDATQKGRSICNLSSRARAAALHSSFSAASNSDKQ